MPNSLSTTMQGNFHSGPCIVIHRNNPHDMICIELCAFKCNSQTNYDAKGIKVSITNYLAPLSKQTSFNGC